MCRLRFSPSLQNRTFDSDDPQFYLKMHAADQRSGRKCKTIFTIRKLLYQLSNPRRRRSRAFLRSPAGQARSSSTGSSSPSSQASTRAAAKGGDRNSSAGPSFPEVGPHPPGQLARDGEVGGSRRVGARSETKCTQIQTSTYICSSTSPAVVAFRSSSRRSSCAAPAGQAGQAKCGGCRATSFHAFSFSFFFMCRTL